MIECEMGGARIKQGEKWEECADLKRIDHLGELGIDGRIVLKK
jgi:hypothetical protein